MFSWFRRRRRLLAEPFPEAWQDGYVVLAWAKVMASARTPHDGRNLVLHEFAHQLDMLNRFADGLPPLAERKDCRRWHDVMTAEYERLVAAAREGRPTLLDPYGATNAGEFFAVATEAFFERAAEVAERHPELYAVLRTYYRQDPAARGRTLSPEVGKAAKPPPQIP